jgi:hypothetical protein
VNVECVTKYFQCYATHTGQHKSLVNLDGFNGGMELAGVLKILQVLVKEHGV